MKHDFFFSFSRDQTASFLSHSVCTCFAIEFENKIGLITDSGSRWKSDCWVLPPFYVTDDTQDPGINVDAPHSHRHPPNLLSLQPLLGSAQPAMSAHSPPLALPFDLSVCMAALFLFSLSLGLSRSIPGTALQENTVSCYSPSWTLWPLLLHQSNSCTLTRWISREMRHVQEWKKFEVYYRRELEHE